MPHVGPNLNIYLLLCLANFENMIQLFKLSFVVMLFGL